MAQKGVYCFISVPILTLLNETEVRGLLVLFLICAFRSGSDRFYLKRAVGLRSDGRDVLYYVRAKNALRLILFYMFFYLMKLALLLLSFSPFIAAVIITGSFTYSGGVSALVFSSSVLICAALFIHGTVFFLRFNSFFFAARYCFATGRFTRLTALFRFAFLCMQNNRRAVFLKKLSFIPWFFSCVLLLPISFVRSYYNQTMAQLAADLIEKHLQNS